MAMPSRTCAGAGVARRDELPRPVCYPAFWTFPDLRHRVQT